MIWTFWLGALMILVGAFGLTLGLMSYGQSASDAWRRRHPSIEQVLRGF